MKRLFLAFVFFSGALLGVARAKDAEYNINVHVSRSTMVRCPGSDPGYQYLNVTIGGKKYELESVLAVNALLALGDYKARLQTDQRGRGDYDIKQVYEFQFPDNSKREFRVVGQSE